MTPNRIREVVAKIRALTSLPLQLAPFFNELGVHPPALPLRGWATFDEQVSALLDARPSAFGFVFGLPVADLIDECRRRSVVTIGTATTVDEAVALDSAGIDILVASAQSAPLLHHRRARELFQDRVAVTEGTLCRQAQSAVG
jgi:nitronate monooxygenase